MTDELQTKRRHYEPPEDLVRRTRGDVSPESQAARALAAPVLASLSARPEQPRLVSSATGGLARLLLAIPAYAVASPPLAEVYRDLLGQLPTATKFVVLTHEAVRAQVEKWLSDAGRNDSEVLTAPDHLHFSVWAEDAYVAVTESGTDRTYLIEPYAFPRYGDGLVADFVANATDVEKSQAPLYFQGGNLLIGDDFFAIGADYPAKTLAYVGQVLRPRPDESPEELIRRLYSEYLDVDRTLHYVGSTVPVPQQQSRRIDVDGEDWTELLYLGNAPGTLQPMFHIDMFLTLAGRGDDGRYRVLVGDPRMAAEMLDSPLMPHAMAEVYDDIAAGLERRGFDVRRNPLPLVYLDDPRDKVRAWYFATANNALVQDTPDDRVVLLPTYGHGEWSELAVTDVANAELWSELGFEPRMLGDFHPFAENLGAVHCIKKYLARSTAG